MMGKVKALTQASPFVPFTIFLADGTYVRIPTVDHIAMLPGANRIFVYIDRESYSIISPLLITGLEIGHQANPA